MLQPKIRVFADEFKRAKPTIRLFAVEKWKMLEASCWKKTSPEENGRIIKNNHSWLENGPFEDAFPIENRDIPASYVSLAEGI